VQELLFVSIYLSDWDDGTECISYKGHLVSVSNASTFIAKGVEVRYSHWKKNGIQHFLCWPSYYGVDKTIFSRFHSPCWNELRKNAIIKSRSRFLQD